MMHNANVMVHFVPNNESENWSGEDTVARPKVVRRGVTDIEDEIDDGRLIEKLHMYFLENSFHVIRVNFDCLAELQQNFSSKPHLTHCLLKLFAKKAFFGHFGGFEAGSRPN